ncbi:MAG TPA: four-carbon acid sugar kinase family protein [Sphingobacterium sp.]|nr:four-carbon acid sugar kinase family protein [Sphingobacterium sp.]
MKPILVIADDLTGAAEVGGIAVRYGLSAQIAHTLKQKADVDIEILNTNTRSMKRDHALSHVGSLFTDIDRDRWSWTFLKFDSALRGHIQQEIPFFRALFGMQGVLFCPANPALGRVIQQGMYLVDGIPIADTGFANDPEFPISESAILSLLGAEDWRLLDRMDALRKEYTYVVPAVADNDGLNHWASISPIGHLCAGSAVFFEALLRNRMEERRPATTTGLAERLDHALFICGSNHVSSVNRLNKLNTDDVVYWRKSGEERIVANALREMLMKKGGGVFAIDPTVSADPVAIRHSMAKVIAILNEKCTLGKLIIEGGATASAVLEALQIDALRPIKERAPGVITCEIPTSGLHVTLKPGSYPWTKDLWAF